MTSQPPPNASSNSPSDTPPNTPREVWPVDIVEYSRGQAIIREGEEADCAYVIRQGEVEVLKKSPDGRSVHIANLRAGEIFGEMCLLEASPIRSATVRAISDRTVVMAISKANFDSQLSGMPEGIRTIMQVLIKRLRKASQHIALLS